MVYIQSMRYKIVAGLVFLLLPTMFAFAVLSRESIATKPITHSQVSRASLLAEVNEERTKRGLKPLVRDPVLDASAQAKASDMDLNNYFGHVNPHTGKHGYEYIQDMTSYSSNCGENIQQDRSGKLKSAEDIIGGSGGFMTSKLHREAILDPDHTVTGFGISGNKIVEHFCGTP